MSSSQNEFVLLLEQQKKIFWKLFRSYGLLVFFVSSMVWSYQSSKENILNNISLFEKGKSLYCKQNVVSKDNGYTIELVDKRYAILNKEHIFALVGCRSKK